MASSENEFDTPDLGPDITYVIGAWYLNERTGKIWLMLLETNHDYEGDLIVRANLNSGFGYGKIASLYQQLIPAQIYLRYLCLGTIMFSVKFLDDV